MCDYCWIIILENIVLEIFYNFNSCDFWKNKSNLIILGIIDIVNYCANILFRIIEISIVWEKWFDFFVFR